MTPIEIGILIIILLFILLIIRLPVGISLIVAAVFGNTLLTSPGPALTQMGAQVVEVTQNHNLAVIPLFVLMGVFLTKTNIGAALYDLMNYFFGQRKGGIAATTFGASVMFAAVSDSVCTTESSLTPASVREMKNHKYEEGFATGITNFGVSMGMLIPPGIALIVYGFLVDESISALILAGIIPGILVAILLMLTILIVVKLKPKLAPEAIKEKIPFPWQALKFVWIVPFIFLIVFGSLYRGWTTPVEAGAIGAFASLVFSLLTKQMTVKLFVDSLVSSAKTTGMLFFIIIGGSMFSIFLTRSLIPSALSQWFTTFDVAPIIIMLFLLLVYAVLGLFIDKLATLVIMTPIVYPIVISLGYNGIWFGVMTIIMLMAGLRIPQAVTGNLAKLSVDGASSKKIFAAQLPFLIPLLVAFIIIAAFPLIATSLPSMMRGW